MTFARPFELDPPRHSLPSSGAPTPLRGHIVFDQVIFVMLLDFTSRLQVSFAYPQRPEAVVLKNTSFVVSLFSFCNAMRR